MHSHYEVLEGFVGVVFDPSKTGSPLFFRSKLAAPRSFHQVSNTVVKLVRQVLLEGRFCWPLGSEINFFREIDCDLQLRFGAG